jgi:hypothetical protein
VRACARGRMHQGDQCAPGRQTSRFCMLFSSFIRAATCTRTRTNTPQVSQGKGRQARQQRAVHRSTRDARGHAPARGHLVGAACRRRQAPLRHAVTDPVRPSDRQRTSTSPPTAASPGTGLPAPTAPKLTGSDHAWLARRLLLILLPLLLLPLRRHPCTSTTTRAP